MWAELFRQISVSWWIMDHIHKVKLGSMGLNALAQMVPTPDTIWTCGEEKRHVGSEQM